MKRLAHRPQVLAFVLGLLFLVLCAGSSSAASATLMVTPSGTVQPGDILQFSAVIAGEKDLAGTSFTISVSLQGTAWSTEYETFTYPDEGRIITVNFRETYTVRADTKSGTSLCFVVLSGVPDAINKEPISFTNCVDILYGQTVPFASIKQGETSPLAAGKGSSPERNGEV